MGHKLYNKSDMVKCAVQVEINICNTLFKWHNFLSLIPNQTALSEIVVLFQPLLLLIYQLFIYISAAQLASQYPYSSFNPAVNANLRSFPLRYRNIRFAADQCAFARIRIVESKQVSDKT